MDSSSGTAVYTYYVSPYLELRNGSSTSAGTPTYYIFAGSQRVAMREGTGANVIYNHQDHLGGTSLTTDSSGTVSQIYDYYPYGSELENTLLGTTDAVHSFTDKELDDSLGLYYFEARWCNPTIGRFVSQDPAQMDGRTLTSTGMVGSKTIKENVFTQKYLKNPQHFNLYSYSFNNPVKYTDDNGEWAGVDNLIAGAAGALLGVISQGVSDAVTGEMSGWESYIGAAVGGAAGAEVFIHTGNVGLSGATAGAIENGTTQVLENLTGSSVGFDGQSFVTETVTSAVTSYIPGPDIPGITSGKGSFQAVSNAVETKLTNGTIQNISAQTGVKIFSVEATNAMPQSVLGGVLDALNN